MQTSISLPFITATADGPKHIESNLTRAKFEDLCSDLLDRCRVPVEQVRAAQSPSVIPFPLCAECQMCARGRYASTVWARWCHFVSSLCLCMKQVVMVRCQPGGVVNQHVSASRTW